MKTVIYVVLFILLFCMFFMVFYEIRIKRYFQELFLRTRADLDASWRQRTLDGRKRLLELNQERTPLVSVERLIQYSGLNIYLPGLTAEWWIAGNAVVLSLIFLAVVMIFGLLPAIAMTALMAGAEVLLIRFLRLRNLRSVGANLLKFLDFLGNYSVTAAEATGVFNQVSRYMDEPLRSALDACFYEAQTTGDAGLALLSMAEKIEHPKFKELARNMEISIRYCADFSAMVSSSRRSIREYLRVSEERRGMLREAAVNMILLLGMSAIVLSVVGFLTEISLWELMTGTLPGRVGLVILLAVFAAFAGQLHKVQC